MLKKIIIFFVFTVLYLGTAGFIATIWVNQNFGNIQWEQIMLNLAQPLNGVAVSLIVSGVILIFCVSLIVAYLLYRLIQKKVPYPMLVCVLIGLLCLSYPVTKWHLFDFIRSRFVIGNIYETYHIIPQVKTNGRNLIIIVLESYEKSFQNSQILEQNLSPKLTQIQQENISFSGFKQLRQCGWTITSLMSSFCGAPLKLNNMFVDLSTYHSFIPGLPCWVETLKEQGYETVLMKSARIQFTGTDKFALQHGFNKAIGYRELQQYDEPPISTWGLNDRQLYKAAKDEINRLAQSNKPFMIVTVQADTHQPVGNINKTCQRTFNDYRDAVICSDKEAGEFVKWIQEQPFYDNTTIVIMGDHLVTATNIDSYIEKIPNREIYFSIINPARKMTAYPHQYTNLDIAPTILDAVGFDFNGQYGLGRSLFRSEKTLLEKIGYNLEYELDCISQKYKEWGNENFSSYFDNPSQLQKTPLNQTISFLEAMNKFVAGNKIREEFLNHVWVEQDFGQLKLQPEKIHNQSVNITIQYVIPVPPQSHRTLTVRSHNRLVFQKRYDELTIDTQTFPISADLIESGTIQLDFNIDTNPPTKQRYPGIELLTIRVETSNKNN